VPLSIWRLVYNKPTFIVYAKIEIISIRQSEILKIKEEIRMLTTAMDGKTLDIITENVQKLKSLFPEIVTEDKIDFEKLQAILGEYIDTDNERYNFTWHGKSKALRLSQTQSTGTLRPCKEESKDWDTTQNLYIEGDNLEVLKLLQKTYHNKVKMIYIDPPYNTGKDFVYPDDYKDNLENYLCLTGQKDENGAKISSNNETSGRYHTNWLNMMYPRLRLARNLLTNDGVIFISIGNEEVDNAKKVCNEVFGESNYRNSIIIRRGAKNLQTQFDTIDALNSGYEYVLMYSKSIDTRFEKVFKETTEEGFIGSWNNHWRGTDRPTMRYEIFGIKPEKGQWRWSKERSLAAIVNYENMLNELGINIPSQEQIDQWYLKKVKELGISKLDLLRLSSTRKPEHYIAPSNKKILNDFWDDIKPNGSMFTSNLFNEKVFDNPKSVDLLVRLVQFIANEGNECILDFFSGSATTAHAVMQLNAEDGGSRKFIMVQLPEPCGEDTEALKDGYKNICEIGKERIRRAGEKIINSVKSEKLKVKSEQGDNTSEQLTFDEIPNVSPLTLNLPDIGFKVFKLDSSNLKKWNPDYDNLESSLDEMLSNYVDGRSELDVVYEIMLKYGIDLTLPVEERDFNGKKVSRYRKTGQQKVRKANEIERLRTNALNCF
jgi:adenine-specific DNA-methyltransferase